MEGDLTSGLRERSDIMLKMMDRWEEDVKATQYVRKADVIGRLQRQMEEEFAAIDRLSAQVLEKIALERAERMALIKSTSANLVKPGPLSLTPGMLSRLGEVAPEATKEKQRLPSQGIVTPPPSKRSHSDMVQAKPKTEHRRTKRKVTEFGRLSVPSSPSAGSTGGLDADTPATSKARLQTVADNSPQQDYKKLSLEAFGDSSLLFLPVEMESPPSEDINAKSPVRVNVDGGCMVPTSWSPVDINRVMGSNY